MQRPCMVIAYFHKQAITPAAAALLLLGLSLGGCATTAANLSPMDARAEVQVSPKTSAYPLVDDT
jgi:hypothetical protein